MFATNHPATRLSNALRDLDREMPGLRDGAESSIHQARVAIRRLRESLALTRGEFDEDALEQFETRLARAFKALGRARDADTAHALVQHVETVFPLAPATLGQLRAAVARSQLGTRRKMIKTIEAVNLAALPHQLAHAYRSADRWFGAGRAWREQVAAHLAHRAEEARTAIAHAGGVYFPKRSHSARIALKQLRYALELADASGVRHIPRALRTLRKAQDVLGEAHDHEVLRERLDDLASEGIADAREARALDQFLDAAIRSLHARYLEARSDILDICAAAAAPPRRRAVIVRSAAAAALALPAVMLAKRY